jgi:hypothetical protein
MDDVVKLENLKNYDFYITINITFLHKVWNLNANNVHSA